MGREKQCPRAAAESEGDGHGSTGPKARWKSWRQNEQPIGRKYMIALARRVVPKQRTLTEHQTLPECVDCLSIKV